MILAVTVAAQRLPALSLEIDRGGVEEDQIDLREQVAPPLKERLLDPVLHAPRAAQCRTLLGQRFVQKRHGPIQMVQLQPVGASNAIRLAPALRRPITAGGKQPVQHRQVDCPLHIEPVASLPQQPGQHRPDPRLLPQPSKDQLGADLLDDHRFGLTRRLRIQDHQPTTQPQPRTQQRVQLSTGLQDIQPSQR